jgi:preprotein translocase subunit SecD
MRQGTLTLLLFIIVLALCSAYIDWPTDPHWSIGSFTLPHPAVKQGLDLQGGVRVVLVPAPGKYSQDTIQSEIEPARTLLETRVNGGLGVNEPNIYVQNSNGQYGIVVELPGLTSGNTFEQIRSLLQTGDLEFWNTGPQPVPLDSTFDPTQFTQYNPGGKPEFTGADLDPGQISVGADQAGRPNILFAMKGSAIARFGSFTQDNVGNFLTVTLDKQVIESARIQSAITGQGEITGIFTAASAKQIVTVLQYGSLPLVLNIATEETVGPTLGQDSITKSYIAAAIGLSLVVLFMLLYYRLPGLLADLALILYAGLTFAVFRVAGVTLSLAGIAGFILSIGMAVDANVLIFERVKEELRAGRLLSSAIDIGWKRAWPSIRDSNISTMITCAVLYYFGSNFGASIIVGFATTLFLGVIISMFTAITVTRTFLNLLVPTGAVSHPALFGLPAGSIALSSLSRRTV